MALIDRVDRRPQIRLSAQDHPHDVGITLANFGQELSSTHAGHAHVRYHHGERAFFGDEPQPLGAVRGRLKFDPLVQRTLNAFQYLRLVVDQKNALVHA
jgi:hypothetical protein